MTFRNDIGLQNHKNSETISNRTNLLFGCICMKSLIIEMPKQMKNPKNISNSKIKKQIITGQKNDRYLLKISAYQPCL